MSALTGLLFSLAVTAVGASTHGSNNNNNNNINNVYSLHQDMSFDPRKEQMQVSAETESTTFYSDGDDEENHCKSASSPSSALLSFVTSDVLAGGSQRSTSFVTMAECRVEEANHRQHYDLYQDEESDEEDDDEDDGSSSMLSNSGLKRSTSYAALGIRGGSTGSVAEAVGTAAVVALAPKNQEFARRLVVAALVTLMYEGALGHLLEFVKIVMQTSPAGTTYGDVLRLITAEKGLAGIWDGFVPWGIVQSVAKGGVFGLAHAMALQYLTPLADNGTLPRQLALTLAGGIAGGFQGFVLSPTLLLKTRVMTNPIFRESMSLWRTTIQSFSIGMEVVREEGVSALMKGSNVFATKRVFDWATRFYFSDVFEALLLSQSSAGKLTSAEKIFASLLGGTASTISTLPLDVLVAKTQDAKKAGQSVSALTLFQEQLKEEGWGGLRDSYMRGFEARLAHVCFTTVVMKTGSGLMYDALYGQK
eukprot:scaffold9_cov58-Attheya_sp.AAC.2